MRLRRVLSGLFWISCATGLLAAEEIEVAGRVLLPSGQPLAEAGVELLPWEDRYAAARNHHVDEIQPASARTNSDDEGRFRFRAPHAGVWRLRITAPGFAPLQTVLRPLIEPIELEVATMKPDSGLTVRVVGPDGAPIAGAQVRVDGDTAGAPWLRGGWSVPWRHGRTAEDGSVRLPRGRDERVAVSVIAPGMELTQRRGLRSSSARLQLRKGLQQKLVLSNSDDKPVVGAVVLVGDRPMVAAVTDDKGACSIVASKSRGFSLNVVAPNHRDQPHLQTRLEPRQERDAEPLQLKLPPRRAVSGRLIDTLHRKAIEGGLVWNQNDPSKFAVSDGSGAFALTGASGERMEINAGATGYLSAQPQTFQLQDDGRTGPTLALKPAAAIEGRIVDENGEAVAGAEVEIAERQAPGMMRIELGRATRPVRAVSNAGGRFRLSPVDPDKTYNVTVRAEGFAATTSPVQDLEPYRTRSGVRIELDRGRRIVGQVVDADGRPLRDASIKLTKAAKTAGAGMIRVMGQGDDAPAHTADSNSEGRFELEGVPAGRFDLTAKRTGFARGSLSEIEVTATEKTLDLGQIVLEPGERLQGIALDRDGQSIEGVEVRAKLSEATMMMFSSMPGREESKPDSLSDPGGWFQLEDLTRDGTYNLAFKRSGFVDATLNNVKVPHLEPLEVRMDPASTVSGTVTDSDGEPIPAASVTLTRSRTIEMGGAVMRAVMTAGETTDGEGRFRFEDQEPGKISLMATASGWQEAKRDAIEIPKGEDITGIDLPLQRGAIIEGRVTSPDGRPAIGATVRRVTESSGPMGMMFDGAATDGSGYYRLEGLAPGAVSIEATHADFPRAVKDVDVREGMNRVNLTMEGGLEVSGQVTDPSGQPIGNASIRLASPGRFWGGPETSSDGNGEFTLRGVKDGEYNLWADAENYAPSQGQQRVQVAGEPVVGLQVQLSPGGTVRGRITGVAEEDFARVSVRTEGAFRESRVDYQGNYRVENLPPGPHTLVASVANSGRQARGQITLEEGVPEAQLDLDFGTGLTLSGRAMQGDEAVVGAMVSIVGEDVDHSGWNQTDHEGRFSVDGLQAGRYRVQLRQFQTGLTYTEQVDLATSREIELEVPTATVAGRVIDAADRRPLAGVQVVLEPAETGGPGPARRDRMATTDLEGRFHLDYVGDGQWRLTAAKEGYAAASEPVVVQFERDVADVKLQLDATEGLILETRLPSGSVPDQLQIAVLDGSGATLTSGTYRTGENGRVRLSSVPPGSWDLIVSGTGAAVANLSANAGGASVPVQLEPACHLSLDVPALHQSSTVALVRLEDERGRPFRTLSWTGAPRQEWRMTSGKLEFGSLPPGSWTVSVASADGKNWRKTVQTTPQTPSKVIIE